MNSKLTLLSALLVALVLSSCGNGTSISSFSSYEEQSSTEVSSESSLPSESDQSSESSSSSSSSEEIPDPKEDFSDYIESSQDGKMLFPKQSVGQGYIGDPMPYYENGKMYVYFLEDARNYRGAFHPISLLATEDYLHYEEHDRVIPFVDNRSHPDYALGTGSCIKDKNGLYHFFYTGHNDRGDSGLPYYEIIQHATSTDLINWTKIPADGFYGGTNDFRDPHVIYMQDLDEYWLLITQFKNTLGTIERYTSKDLKTWTHAGTFYRNPKNYHNMECSTLINYKGYWYLSFSEQEPERVVRYRYRRSLTEGEWITPTVDHLDAEGLYAGKIAGDADRIFMYGWTGTKSRDTSSYGWGGNLVGHELYQKENGELGIKAIKEVKEGISNRYPHKTLDAQEIVTKLEVTTSGYQALAFEPFKQNRYARLSFDYTPNSKAGTSGMMFNISASDQYGSLAIQFDSGNSRIAFYPSVSEGKFGDYQIQMPFDFENGKKIHFDFYYGQDMGVLYANGEVALSTRLIAARNKPFSLFSNGKRCVFENVKFYE